jgi:DNA-binding transcriptional MerR regulator
MLDRRDLARISGVTPATIAAWERAARLPTPVRLGKRRLWTPSTIADLLDGEKRDH